MQGFQFNPYAQFVIIYVDEDDDIVTMPNNSDFLDVFHQGLNPLFLEVSLMSHNNKVTRKQSQSQPSTPRGERYDLHYVVFGKNGHDSKTRRNKRKRKVNLLNPLTLLLLIAILE